jgi:hypothetical protein
VVESIADLIPEIEALPAGDPTQEMVGPRGAA